MLEEMLAEVVGRPGEGVTHWGISRIETVRGEAKPSRQTHPNEERVRLREWPIEELTLDEIKKRWGAGTFKLHWFCNDPEHPTADQRRTSGGHGPVFTIEPDVVPDVAPMAPPPPVHVAAPSGDFSFALQLMQASDQRAAETMRTVMQMAQAGQGGGASAEMTAAVARLEARIEADKREREQEQRHRDELQRRDNEIAELKRAAERAAEREESSAGPSIEPGTPILEQLPVLLINGLMGLAAKNPEAALAFASPLLERIMPSKAPSAPPPPVSRETTYSPIAVAPRPVAPRVPVVHVVRDPAPKASPAGAEAAPSSVLGEAAPFPGSTAAAR
jgi:hypothetical protein